MPLGYRGLFYLDLCANELVKKGKFEDRQKEEEAGSVFAHCNCLLNVLILKSLYSGGEAISSMLRGNTLKHVLYQLRKILFSVSCV